jgi:hypothetical protein
LKGEAFNECRGKILYAQTQPANPREAYSSVVETKRSKIVRSGGGETKVDEIPPREKLFLGDGRVEVQVSGAKSQ